MKLSDKILSLAAVLVTIAGGLFITSCSKKTETTALNSATKLRVMSNPNYFPIIIADKKGFFREEFGDSVKLEFNHHMNGGSAAMEAMTAGEIEFAVTGDMPLIQAKNNGLDVVTLSSLFVSKDGYQLVAAKDSGIHSIEDIRGKKVAVMLASTNYKLLLKYLEAKSMTLDDIEVVPLKSRDQLAAFVGKNVDAAVTQVPYTTRIIESTGAYIVTNADDYDTILTFISGSGKYLKENPEYGVKFLRAVIKADKWTRENLDEALKIVSEEDGNSPIKQEQEYWDTRTFHSDLGTTEISALQDTIDYLYKQGTISAKLDAKSFSDESYLKKAKGL